MEYIKQLAGEGYNCEFSLTLGNIQLFHIMLQPASLSKFTYVISTVFKILCK